MAMQTTPMHLSSETVSSVASDTGDDATSDFAVTEPSSQAQRGRPKKESGVGIFYLRPHYGQEHLSSILGDVQN